MKINSPNSTLASTLAFAATLTFSFSAIAQHGGGGGHPAGVGGGSGSAPSGVGAGNSGRSGDPGFGNSSSVARPSAGSQSPGTALNNPRLDSALTNALGKSGISVPGGNLQTACGGFKNLGQCVAAMHVAKNLNLSFGDLQKQMTGANSVSLGKAIQGLGGPNVDAKSEAKKANKQANEDLNTADSTS